MKPIQQTLKELDLNMETLQGRYRFAMMVLEGRPKKRSHPIQPEVLAGASPSTIRQLRQKTNVANEDKRTIDDYTQWREDVLKIEGVNALNLRCAIRSVSIFDEAIADALPGEKEEIQLKREVLIDYITNEFEVHSSEWEEAVTNPFGFARKKCTDLAAFPPSWRDPGS